MTLKTRYTRCSKPLMISPLLRNGSLSSGFTSKFHLISNKANNLRLVEGCRMNAVARSYFGLGVLHMLLQQRECAAKEQVRCLEFQMERPT